MRFDHTLAIKACERLKLCIFIASLPLLRAANARLLSQNVASALTAQRVSQSALWRGSREANIRRQLVCIGRVAASRTTKSCLLQLYACSSGLQIHLTIHQIAGKGRTPRTTWHTSILLRRFSRPPPPQIAVLPRIVIFAFARESVVQQSVLVGAQPKSDLLCPKIPTSLAVPIGCPTHNRRQNPREHRCRRLLYGTDFC